MPTRIWTETTSEYSGYYRHVVAVSIRLLKHPLELLNSSTLKERNHAKGIKGMSWLFYAFLSSRFHSFPSSTSATTWHLALLDFPRLWLQPASASAALSCGCKANEILKGNAKADLGEIPAESRMDHNLEQSASTARHHIYDIIDMYDM